MRLLSSIKTWCILWVWKHTPNCAEMSRLASRSLEQRPGLVTWLKMRLHYRICAWCKRYFKQLKFLHQAAPHLNEQAGMPPIRGLSAEAKQRMVQRLQAAKKDPS